MTDITDFTGPEMWSTVDGFRETIRTKYFTTVSTMVLKQVQQGCVLLI